jgi:hypothetical protein
MSIVKSLEMENVCNALLVPILMLLVDVPFMILYVRNSMSTPKYVKNVTQVLPLTTSKKYVLKPQCKP